MEASPGECEVFIDVKVGDQLVRVRAHPSLKIEGSGAIETSLRNLGCEVIWEGFAAPIRAAAATAN